MFLMYLFISFSSVCLSALSLNGDDPNNSSSEEAIDEEAEIDTKITSLYNQGMEYNEILCLLAQSHRLIICRTTHHLRWKA